MNMNTYSVFSHIIAYKVLYIAARFVYCKIYFAARQSLHRVLNAWQNEVAPVHGARGNSLAQKDRGT